MADFFKDLAQHIEDGWDDVKEAVKDDFSDGYDLTKPAGDAMAAGIVKSMMDGQTMTSPVNSTVAVCAATPGHMGITFTDQLGIVAQMPQAQQSGVQFLVKEGEPVTKGTPLMRFTEEALAQTTIDLVLPLKETSADGMTRRVIRVYGPVEAD